MTGKAFLIRNKFTGLCKNGSGHFIHSAWVERDKAGLWDSVDAVRRHVVYFTKLGYGRPPKGYFDDCEVVEIEVQHIPTGHTFPVPC